jgi:hypothetical protein
MTDPSTQKGKNLKEVIFNEKKKRSPTGSVENGVDWGRL